MVINSVIGGVMKLVIDFPYESFPIKLTHKDGKDKKTCWFQCVEHYQKYIDRHKLKPNDFEVITNNVEIVGKGTRRKSNKKR
jgi:hypothetical protein